PEDLPGLRHRVPLGDAAVRGLRDLAGDEQQRTVRDKAVAVVLRHAPTLAAPRPGFPDEPGRFPCRSPGLSWMFHGGAVPMPGPRLPPRRRRAAQRVRTAS